MGWNSCSRAAAFALAALLAGGAALSGCDSGPSALPARDHSQAAVAEAAQAARDNARPERRGESATRSAANDDTPLYQGKPLWSASRKASAEENAQSHFERNGQDFGAKDVDAYVAKAHAFVGDPPKGALTLKRRNGDTLIYDPKANVFAVATKAGAPRTMFKPEDGMDYWERQKVKEAQSASRGKASSDG